MGFHQISFETTQVLSSFLDSRGLRHTGAINANGIYPFVWLLTAPKGHYQLMARTLRNKKVSGAAQCRTCSLFGVSSLCFSIAILQAQVVNAPVKNRLFTKLTSRAAGCLSADCSREGRAPRCVAKKGKHHAGLGKQEEHRNVGCRGVTCRGVRPE